LQKKLADLEDQIKADKRIVKSPDCIGNSFPMARGLGEVIPSPSVKGAFDSHKWDATLTSFGDKKLDADERRYRQSEVGQWYLYARVKQAGFDVASINGDLDKLSEVLDVPRRADVPRRSVEAQFVKMLREIDSGLSKNADVLKLAVQVRMLAEQSAL